MLCWPCISGHGVYPLECFVFQGDSHSSKWLSAGYNFWVKDGGVSLLPHSALGLVPWRHVQILCMLPVSVSSCVCKPCRVGRLWFLAVLHSVWWLYILPPLPQDSLSPEKRNLIVISLLRLCVTRSLTLCALSNFMSLYLFPSSVIRTISNDGYISHWSMSTAEYH